MSEYSTSALGMKITKARAIQELASHGLTTEEDIQTLYEDLGEHEEYNAWELLNWLGH